MAQAHGDDGVRISYCTLAGDRAAGGESRMGERHEGLSLREAEGVRWGSWSRSDHVWRCHRRPLRNAEPRTLAPERNDVSAALSMVEGVERDAKDGGVGIRLIPPSLRPTPKRKQEIRSQILTWPAIIFGACECGRSQKT